MIRRHSIEFAFGSFVELRRASRSVIRSAWHEDMRDDDGRRVEVGGETSTAVVRPAAEQVSGNMVLAKLCYMLLSC